MPRLEKILGHLTSLLFILMIALVTIQVINRFTIQQVTPWTEELTRVAYIGLIFIGSIYAAVRREHVRVAVVFDALPAIARRLLHVAFSLISAAFMGVVAYGAIIYAQIGWTAPLPTMSWLKMGYLMAMVAACAVAMAVAFFVWGLKAPESPRQPTIENL